MRAKKDVTQRIKEMIELRSKLNTLGIHPDSEGMKMIVEKMNDFVKNGNGFTGVIPLEDCGRMAYCKFSLTTVSTITLKVRK